MKSDATHLGGMSKIDAYKWSLKDRQGSLKFIDKSLLEVDKTYQRDHSSERVLNLASEWSWVACGAITVAKRAGGSYNIIDGQHRVLAALKRSDIVELPCVVFDMHDIKEEASGFVESNTHRKSMNIIDKHRANIVRMDETALAMQRVFDRLGITIIKSGNDAKNTIKCIGVCYRAFEDDPSAFVKALTASQILSEGVISEHLVGGLWYISHSSDIDIGVASPFFKRLSNIPISLVKKSIAESRSYYIRGGNKVYAIGILNAVNKGLRKKYLLPISQDMDSPQN